MTVSASVKVHPLDSVYMFDPNEPQPVRFLLVVGCSTLVIWWVDSSW